MLRYFFRFNSGLQQFEIRPGRTIIFVISPAGNHGGLTRILLDGFAWRENHGKAVAYPEAA